MDLKLRIKHLSIEIRNYFFSQKQQNIRKQIKPGNTKSLWNAVNASKDIGSAPLPNVMSFGGDVKTLNPIYSLGISDEMHDPSTVGIHIPHFMLKFAHICHQILPECTGIQGPSLICSVILTDEWNDLRSLQTHTQQ